MLQSMTVFLLVFTMINGKWMTELAGGGLFVCCSLWRFLCTRFLKAICCNRTYSLSKQVHQNNSYYRQKSSFSPVRWVLEVATVFVWFSPNVFASPPPGSGTPEQSLWAGQSIWSLFSLWRWCSWPSAHWVHHTHAAECSSGHTHAEKRRHTESEALLI